MGAEGAGPVNQQRHEGVDTRAEPADGGDDGLATRHAPLVARAAAAPSGALGIPSAAKSLRQGLSENAKLLFAALGSAAEGHDQRSWGTILRTHPLALGLLVAGVAGTLAAAEYVHIQQENQAHAAFDYRAEQVSGVLSRGLSATTEVLLALPPLFETAQPGATPSREAFHRFVAPGLARHPGIAMIEWAPVVDEADRARFEGEQTVNGVAYRIRDLVDGKPTPAPTRSAYTPLQFIEPLSMPALGHDLRALRRGEGAAATTDESETPATRAVTTGLLTVSARFTLLEDDPSVASVSAYAPAYRDLDHVRPQSAEQRKKALIGVAVAVFRLRPVVETILAGEDLRGLSLTLRDDNQPRGKRTLITTSALPPAIAKARPFVHTRAFAFGDRTYAAQIDGDPQAFATGHAARWIVALGLLLTLGLSAAAFVGREMTRLRASAKLAAKLGMYVLERRLGAGAMGVVYLGRHALLRRPTAIKVLPTNGVDRAAVERFELEVRVTSQLTHPNTIAVYDYGRSPRGIFYYAMEFLDGPDLQDLVATTGRMPAARVVHVLRGVAGSLAEAHAAGLVHRDVKPANVVLCRRGNVADFVKVLDFGLVRSIETVPDKSEGAAGTPLYMAPEALTAPDHIRPSVDIYAVGAVGYFLLTGRPPIEAVDLSQLFAKVLTVVPDPPSLWTSTEVPAALEQLLLRCLEKDPAKRPVSMDELLAELDRCELAIGRWRQADAQAFWATSGRALLEARRAVTEAPADAAAATLIMEIDLQRLA
jgi:CHASE1-domain containing sensor protein/tRNA A-37 threonylcarbamoyl transferase component Bud32